MGDAVYNEIEPFAAQWLRNLIDAGHVAPGVVDDRSIVDLRPDDVAGPGQRHFFAGIGVWSYALRLAGVPDTADVWTASCPCQPFSGAGRRRGFADARHLWPVLRGLVAECRPAILLGEQVASRDGRTWFAAVRADLEALGYAVGAADLCAAGVGASHIRQRLYFVAYADKAGRREQWSSWLRADGDASQWHDADGRSAPGALANSSSDERGSRRTGAAHGDRAREPAGRSAARWLGDTGGARGRRNTGTDARAKAPSSGEGACTRRLGDEPVAASADDPWADCEWLPCSDGKARPVEPGVSPLAHGVAGRVGRLRAYGNSIVAQQAAAFVNAALAAVWGLRG